MPRSQRAARPSTEALRAPDRRRLYQQLAARLLDYVEVTGLRVGDRLPSERDLAQALRVSRASVRQATVALEVRGTLEVRHGDGIYLMSLPRDSGHLMELMTQRHRLPAILEAREALETQLAALAAARRTETDLAAMDRRSGHGRRHRCGRLRRGGDRLFMRLSLVRRKVPARRLHGFLAAPISETRRSSLGEPGPPGPCRPITGSLRRSGAGDAPGARQAMRRHVNMVADIGGASGR